MLARLLQKKAASWCRLGLHAHCCLLNETGTRPLAVLYTAEGAHHYLHEADTLPPTRCSCPQRCTNGCRCLLQKKAGRKEARSSSFNKLLLRFNHLDKGFTKCREVFHSLDVDGNNVIDLEVCLHLNTTERGEFPFPERGAVHTGLASGGGSRMASLQALSLVAPPECLLRRRPGGRQQRH